MMPLQIRETREQAVETEGCCRIKVSLRRCGRERIVRRGEGEGRKADLVHHDLDVSDETVASSEPDDEDEGMTEVL
jgi:hypothetical protein